MRLWILYQRHFGVQCRLCRRSGLPSTCGTYTDNRSLLYLLWLMPVYHYPPQDDRPTLGVLQACVHACSQLARSMETSSKESSISSRTRRLFSDDDRLGALHLRSRRRLLQLSRLFDGWRGTHGSCNGCFGTLYAVVVYRLVVVKRAPHFCFRNSLFWIRVVVFVRRRRRILSFTRTESNQFAHVSSAH